MVQNDHPRSCRANAARRHERQHDVKYHLVQRLKLFSRSVPMPQNRRRTPIAAGNNGNTQKQLERSQVQAVIEDPRDHAGKHHPRHVRQSECRQERESKPGRRVPRADAGPDLEVNTRAVERDVCDYERYAERHSFQKRGTPIRRGTNFSPGVFDLCRRALARLRDFCSRQLGTFRV